MTTTTARLPVGAAASGISYRMYRGLDDVDGLARAVDRVRDATGMLAPVNHEAMRHRYANLVNSDPTRDCVLVVRGDETVGYARVEWHDLVDGDRIYDSIVVVQPDARGLGIGQALLDWAEGRTVDIAAGRPTDRRTWFNGNAYHGDTEIEEAFAARGYVAVRWDTEMLRPTLDRVDDVPLADGYEIRTPEAHELPAVHAMAMSAFADDWGQHEANEYRLEDWLTGPLFRRDLLVVAWKGNEPAALVENVLEDRAADGSVRGLLDSVCTHPRDRRLGLARACIVESLRRLRDAGATSAYLNVDTDNENRAYALYESCGFRVASGSATYRKPFPDVGGRR